MTVRESINIMCKRCMEHEMCQGTGCEATRTLRKHWEVHVEMAEELRRLKETDSGASETNHA